MLVEEARDIKRGFWTKPRPWVLFLILGLELVNFTCGPMVFYRAGVQYKDKGWIEASRICLQWANWANPWSFWGKRADAYMRARLPKNNISQDAQSRNIDGYNLDESGQTDKAIKTFEKLISDCPKFEWPYNNLANIMLESGDAARAKELCEQALAINPDYANAHVTLGLVFDKLGNEKEASRHREEARRLLADCGEAYAAAPR